MSEQMRSTTENIEKDKIIKQYAELLYKKYCEAVSHEDIKQLERFEDHYKHYYEEALKIAFHFAQHIPHQTSRIAA